MFLDFIKSQEILIETLFFRYINIMIAKDKQTDRLKNLPNEPLSNISSKNTQVQRKQHLQIFGLTAGIFISLVIGVLIPWVFHTPRPIWPLSISLLLLLPALFRPQILTPVYRIWLTLSNALNQFNTTLLLALVFLLLITPMGWIMRLFGNDPMQRKIQKKRSSYRTPSTVRNSDHMEKPF